MSSVIPSISFDLHKLGWKAFEDLVACILREIWGQTFQTFAEGVDGGRDGAFYGEWFTQKAEKISGSFTVQCKHTSKREKLLPASVVKEEIPKITTLASKGLCDNYIFVTNFKVTAKRAQNAEDAFVKAGAKFAKIYESSWINASIAERPTLRRLVPRLYGLGDLTQIVTHQAYRQAREVLDSLIPDLACFVPTEAYRKCAHALKKHGFVLLIGEPASGKTMIANLLALSAADEWDLQTLMLAGPEEFSQYWNPDDPGQFLWVDDAFGANQYDSGRVCEWNHRLPKLKTAIRNGARVVFTSRDYIFNSAKDDLKISSFELFDDSRVIIEVEGISEAERQMILYNHLKCGKQSADFRKKVKPFLLDAANTPKFLPEIARRFASPKFTANLSPRAKAVTDFFKKPMDWLQGILSGLVAADKTAIALVFISGGFLPAPIPEEEVTLRTIATLRSNLGDVKAALLALNGSFLRRPVKDEKEYWCFRHPTIRDAFATLVGTNPELVDIYLAGVTTGQLLQEVTCGEIGLEGVKIIIPPERYGVVIERLQEFKKSKSWFYNPIKNFLARRCSGNFIIKYLSETQEIGDIVESIFSLEKYDDNISILRRLHADNLLSEEIRKKASDRICLISSKSYSSHFMDKEIVGSLLVDDEIGSHFNNLKGNILHDGDDIIGDISSDWDGEDDPEFLFYDIEQTLIVIKENGTEEEKEKARILLSEITDEISEMQSKMTPEARYETLEAEETSNNLAHVGRSIFDDVDE